MVKKLKDYVGDPGVLVDSDSLFEKSPPELPIRILRQRYYKGSYWSGKKVGDSYTLQYKLNNEWVDVPVDCDSVCISDSEGISFNNG